MAQTMIQKMKLDDASMDKIKVMEQHQRFMASAQVAAQTAKQAVEALCESSVAIDPKKDEQLPKFSQKEISLGKYLGKGGFNCVFEVDAITLRYEKRSNGSTRTQQQQHTERRLVARNCKRGKRDARFAVKFLRDATVQDPNKFKVAAADLAVEAKFLSNINHPNIVSIRGISQDGPDGFATGIEGGFFIIIDRMHITLEKKISHWKAKDAIASMGIAQMRAADVRPRRSSILQRVESAQNEFLASRLRVALSITHALEYLHKRNIIFRDLKPDNVGFDSKGVVKLFDFGLAKELKSRDRNPDGTYKATGNTGSRRYMAPEVAVHAPYNHSVDIYSLGTMLWEMVSLERPFAGMDKKTHFGRVIYSGERPPINSSWPPAIQQLIETSWSSNSRKRPTAQHVIEILQGQILQLTNGKTAFGPKTHRARFLHFSKRMFFERRHDGRTLASRLSSFGNNTVANEPIVMAPTKDITGESTETTRDAERRVENRAERKEGEEAKTHNSKGFSTRGIAQELETKAIMSVNGQAIGGLAQI